MKLKISYGNSTVYIHTEYVEIYKGVNVMIAKSTLQLKKIFRHANVTLDGDKLGKFREVKFI